MSYLCQNCKNNNNGWCEEFKYNGLKKKDIQTCEKYSEDKVNLKTIDINKINEILDKEIEFAKGCGMPQFVMGIQQARKILNEELGENK